jgi:hypothetical protein
LEKKKKKETNTGEGQRKAVYSNTTMSRRQRDSVTPRSALRY